MTEKSFFKAKMQASVDMLQLRRAITFLRSTPVTAHWIGGLTLAAWMFKAVVLDTIPEPLPRLFELGRIVEGLFSAVVAGYVFYILFALLPDYQSRNLLAPFILGKVRGIVGDCLSVLNEIEHASGHSLALRTVQPEQLLASFSAVKTNTPPRMIHQSGIAVTWNQFFEYRQERSRTAIADLFRQGRFLDAELISILAEIDNCSFFFQVKACSGMPISNVDLSAWGHSFHRYLTNCRQLAYWHDLHRLPDLSPLL